MLRNPKILNTIYGINPTLVIHVGAQNGQSRIDYIKLGAKRFYWFEALPELAAILRNRYKEDEVFEGVVWSTPDIDIDFFQLNESANSSAIKIKQASTHQIQEIHKLRTLTLDSVFADKELETEALLVLDVQGAELEVLKGATNLLKSIHYLICEIGVTDQGYDSVPTEIDITSILSQYGLKKSISRISKNGTYIDQLYINKSLAKRNWINIIDKVFDFSMRARHALIFHHRQEIHYHCAHCGF
jgi:FkbM family methyltransferase